MECIESEEYVMKSLDITKLTMEDLKSLEKSIPAEMERRRAEKIAQLRQKMNKVAAAAGYDLRQIIGGEMSRKRKKQAHRLTPLIDKNGLRYAGAGRRPRGWDHKSARPA